MAEELRRSRGRVVGSITRLKNTLSTILQTDPSDASDDQNDLIRVKLQLVGEKETSLSVWDTTLQDAIATEHDIDDELDKIDDHQTTLRTLFDRINSFLEKRTSPMTEREGDDDQQSTVTNTD